ncbi:MAG: DNA helicase RecQ [Acidobacteria bacterium]|nr:MAG: DNA helicase RecQ [Acidobacteriota bacterium]
MLEQARQLLKTVFGFDSFRGQQEAAVAAALAGEDCMVLMPTGGGKSLCYQLPSMVRPGVGIIVSPLIALMHDQISGLEQLGVEAACLNSTLNADERKDVTRRLHAGTLQLLYIAPERLLMPGTLQFLEQFPVSIIAIDEAHCVSQWGHDFRKDYLGLHVLKDHFPGTPVMALTATADGRTRNEIVERLALRNPQRLIEGFDRPNIRYTVTIKLDAKKQLLAFLAPRKGECGIVYCLSRRKVEATADLLVRQGHDALPYHAGLPAEVRSRNQRRFLREDGVIIVATIAFGMGIDKPDVRFVVHMDLPRSIEAYYQETGRAGRDGEPAEAHMVYGLQDVVQLGRMVDESGLSDRMKVVERQKLNALLGWCEITTCRRQALLAHFEDSLDEPCGNCDICLNPPVTWDGTEAAQKMLSCVYRTGQRFGTGHVIDVLVGKDTEKTLNNGHQQLSTFGIGQDRSRTQWQSIARQLLVQEFLYSDPERYGALTLTPRSGPLLRDELRLQLREDPVKPARAKRSGGAREVQMSEELLPIWNALRACRKRLAEEKGVPPYVIFHDRTLHDLMAQRPASVSELLLVDGIGQVKADRYGEIFLEVLRSA